MKKTIAFITSLCICASAMLSTAAGAASKTVPTVSKLTADASLGGGKTIKACDDVFYELDDDGTLTIRGTGYIDEPSVDKTKVKKIVIMDGITKIMYNSFSGFTALESITIPDSVTYIEAMAFKDCTSLREITIPDSVTYIGAMAFGECMSLREITIPDSVTYISGDAFFWCDGIETVTISKSSADNTEGIGLWDNLFKDCSSLVTVNIEGNINSIGEETFYNCKKLENITIPDTVTRIENMAFSGCISLKDVKIPSSVNYIGDEAFEGTKWLEEEREKESLVVVNGILIDGKGCKGDVVIPDNVTRINTGAFSSCALIRSVVIPDSVTSIGDRAFRNCYELKDIVIPESVTEIGAASFEGTEWLINKAEEETFIVVNGNLVYVGDISGEVTVPDNVVKICGSVFSNNNKITSVTIPDSVTDIGAYVFERCSSLETVEMADSVISIGEGIFYDCKKLSSLKLSDFIKEIPAYAFNNCNSLESIDLPKEVTFIDEYAFIMQSNIKSLVLPSKLESGRAFHTFRELESITVLNPEFDFRDGINLRKGATVYGYEYSTAEEYANLQHLTFIPLDGPNAGIPKDWKRKCGEKAECELMHGGEIIIYGKGAVDEKAFYGVRNLRTIHISYNITSIGDNAFEGCSKLEYIELTSSIRYLGKGMLKGCDNLKQLRIDSYYCDIEELEIPESSDVVIYGYEGSTAQRYAKAHNYKFESLGEYYTYYKAGNANCDRGVDLADAVTIMQALANPDKYGLNGTEKTHITAQGIENADVIGNDGMTTEDAGTIQRYLLHIIDEIPVEK